ncbi:uncharacterized protein LOC144334751 [Macaca mulatta]
MRAGSRGRPGDRGRRASRSLGDWRGRGEGVQARGGLGARRPGGLSRSSGRGRESRFRGQGTRTQGPEGGGRTRPSRTPGPGTTSRAPRLPGFPAQLALERRSGRPGTAARHPPGCRWPQRPQPTEARREPGRAAAARALHISTPPPEPLQGRGGGLSTAPGAFTTGWKLNTWMEVERLFVEKFHQSFSLDN